MVFLQQSIKSNICYTVYNLYSVRIQQPLYQLTAQRDCALLDDDKIISVNYCSTVLYDKIKIVVTEDVVIRRYTALRMKSLCCKDEWKLNGVQEISQRDII